MNLSRISEKFVINKLKKITNGNLKLINYDGKVYHFGDLKNDLKTDIKVNNSNFGCNSCSTIFINNSCSKNTSDFLYAKNCY